MAHAELGREVIGLLVARDVDHRCERCARSLAEAGCSGAVPRAWFHIPLLVRTALLAGLALATRDPATATKAMWATTSGMHRAHFRYVLADMPGGHELRLRIAA